MTTRDHNQEYQDNADRLYAYDFDGIIRHYLLKRLAPHFTNRSSALELGCYLGDMTAQLLDYFDAMTVIEAASDLADQVRARFPARVEVITATFAESRFERTFDQVFLIHTLEHLDDPVGDLKRMRDWLTPNGRLFVAVPNARALSRQIATEMGLIDHHTAVTPAEAQHGHRRTYSQDTFLLHLRQAGYRILDHGGILVKPFANYQFDQAMAQGIVTPAYLEACHVLAKSHPELSASLYAVCARPDHAPLSSGSPA